MLSHDIVIVGGGAAGIATAASLLRRRRGLDVAIIEPRDTHYYQPGFTLIGAGVFTPDHVKKPMAEVMPKGATWLRTAVRADAGNMPNAKTAAAVRKQAPVAAVNALAILDGHEPKAAYDGYGSCPLTLEKGKILLAEFGYGGVLQPTLPTWIIDGTRPSRLAWLLKKDLLPPIYWNLMLKGREWLASPRQRHSGHA